MVVASFVRDVEFERWPGMLHKGYEENVDRMSWPSGVLSEKAIGEESVP